MSMNNVADAIGGLLVLATISVLVGSRNTRQIVDSLGTNATRLLRTAMGR